MIKNPPAKRETQVRSLSQEDPLKKEVATHSSIPAWRIPRREEPGGLQCLGLERARRGSPTKHQQELVVRGHHAKAGHRTPCATSRCLSGADGDRDTIPGRLSGGEEGVDAKHLQWRPAPWMTTVGFLFPLPVCLSFHLFSPLSSLPDAFHTVRHLCQHS